MKTIPFLKYTAYGNNFVILDESHTRILSEIEKSRFAYQATNMFYGIGADSFLILQPYTADIIQEINMTYHYWRDIPEPFEADYIFRIFEKNGQESSSCGNGLLCIANYLYQQYEIESARILTEIPTETPKVVTVGTTPGDHVNWVNMGYPRHISAQMSDASLLTPYNPYIDIIEDILVVFDHQHLAFVKNPTSLRISGYLVFAGEPHLVIFSETAFSLTEFAQRLFIDGYSKGTTLKDEKYDAEHSSWLVDYIGTYINEHYAHIFPMGVNINFVRVHKQTKALEFRCFERGVDRETLACGTGAVAIAYVAQSLNLLSTSQMTVWPHCCRWYDPTAEVYIQKSETGWFLYGNPTLLFEGIFYRDRAI